MRFEYISFLKTQFALLFTGLMLFTISCEDDAAATDSHDHSDTHTDADGFKLEDASGNQVYRQFEGDTSGVVTLSVGDTLELAVHFLDHDGEEITHDDHDDSHDDNEVEESSLVLSGADPSVALVEVEEHEEEGDDHDHEEEEHGMAIHVVGVGAGTTSFSLVLMHEGHADYTSTFNVPVTVN